MIFISMKLKITPHQANLILHNIGKNASIKGTVKDFNKILDAKKGQKKN